MNGLIFDDATCEFVRPMPPRIKDYLWMPPITRGPITMTDIKRAVCNHYGLDMADMTSNRRFKTIAHARQVAMFLCREMTERSLPEIGRAFGGRDHSTVFHGIRQVRARVLDSKSVASSVENLRDVLRRR